ncbi:MAG: HEPN domain-containing protein [Pseudomonadota bacterium]
MTNQEMSRHYFDQSALILDEARNYFKKSCWNMVVRRAQEVVELVTKAALRRIGVEVPRLHDVGWLLEQNADKLPSLWKKEIESVKRISRVLRKERETSFYGDDETDLPPSELYSRLDAEQAIKDAEFILGLAKPAGRPKK